MSESDIQFIPEVSAENESQHRSTRLGWIPTDLVHPYVIRLFSTWRYLKPILCAQCMRCVLHVSVSASCHAIRRYPSVVVVVRRCASIKILCVQTFSAEHGFFFFVSSSSALLLVSILFLSSAGLPLAVRLLFPFTFAQASSFAGRLCATKSPYE